MGTNSPLHSSFPLFIYVLPLYNIMAWAQLFITPTKLPVALGWGVSKCRYTPQCTHLSTKNRTSS